MNKELNGKPLLVARPYIPNPEKLAQYIAEINSSRWLSNSGPLHQRLEAEISKYLGVPYVSLVANGTAALMIALKALNLPAGSEVITTPFTFLATANAIIWAGLKPVFADVCPETLNLDPVSVESLISENTKAILPVHCYGRSCDVASFEAISKQYAIAVVYDSAHAFGVSDEGGSILRHGDFSVLSLHATKVFSSIEGGVVVSSSLEQKGVVDRLRNFGLNSDQIASEIGLNGKMNEFCAAFGLLQLEDIDECIKRRLDSAAKYGEALAAVPGLSCLFTGRELGWNGAYFPVLVDSSCALNRDELSEFLGRKGVMARKYFYPLVSEMPAYCDKYRSGGNAVAERFSKDILCLPLYADMTFGEQEYIIQSVLELLLGAS